MKFSGSLACIGAGMMLEAHLTPATRSHIHASDVIFSARLDAASSIALSKLHPDVRHLCTEDGSLSSIQLTDEEIVELVLAEIRNDKRVCVAVSSHPGTGATIAHMLIRAAHQEGFHTHLEPAISIEDCIYADLRIDPGKYGCQQYDVSQIMMYRRSIDTSAYLILWQFGSEDMRPEPRRKLLIDVLAREYPLDHKVFAYVPPRMNAPFEFTKLAIESLVQVEARPLTAIVIPPAADLLPDKEIRARLARLGDAPGFDS